MKLEFNTILMALLLTSSCAQKLTSRERMDEANASSRSHPAGYISESFYLDYRSPADRDPQNMDFFYKHCKLVGREHAAPSRSDWECSDP